MITQVKKRDGRIVEFNQQKITNAIFKAAQSVGGDDMSLAVHNSNDVFRVLGEHFNTGVPTVEDIQDIVEEVLIKNGHAKTAKAYILYRDLHRKLRDVRALIDAKELINGYLDRTDWRVQENANMGYSLQGLNNHIFTEVNRAYWLNSLYPKEARDAHVSGDLHIHDLYLLAPYCCGWDLEDLLIMGFGGAPGKLECAPAKHFSSALGQVVNFLYTVQGEVAGAVAFSNFDTLLAPFISFDHLSKQEVKQQLQEFIFNMNVPTRVGGQTPFTNITLDFTIPEHLKKENIIIGGEKYDEFYEDFQAEMDLLNECLLEVMLEGDASGKPLTWPIPTVNITKDFDWDNPRYAPLWEVTRRYGIPYFANFVNSNLCPDDVRSMCCRLRLDITDLMRRAGGLFGSAPSTGCYDEKTEILTTSGWKSFAALTLQDELFTLADDNEIQVHKPLRLFIYDYEDEMIHFEQRSLNLLVTPNHHMVVDHRRNDKNTFYREFIEAQDFNQHHHLIPKSGFWVGNEQETFTLPEITYTKYGGGGRIPYKVNCPAIKFSMGNWLRFLGIWLAEGSYDNDKIAPSHGYRVVICCNDEEAKNKIRKVLNDLSFNYREYDMGFEIPNKQLWTYMKQLGRARQKYIPREFKILSAKQLQILWDWLMLGDGHTKKRGSPQSYYYTSSKQLADDFQEITAKLGHMTTITSRQRIGYYKGKSIIPNGPAYEISVLRSKRHRIRSENIHREFYKGKVYCCEVPNHTVLVRRNGRMAWCGNSIGVVTLNLARIGYLTKSKEEFLYRVGELMDIAKDSLLAKRKVIERFTEQGLYPYSKHYLAYTKERFGGWWSGHFNTVGLCGMNEATLNLLKEDLTSAEAREFSREVLEFMNARLLKYQSDTGQLFNLEATPAESTAYRFALLDRAAYPDIITAGEEEPYYTNSTQLPVNATDDLFQALEWQDETLPLYTGGSVFHAFLGEQMPSAAAVKNLVQKIATKFRLPYFTITPTFSICPSHGYLNGERKECPNCDEKPLIYSRVVGYLRPVSEWNAGKISEYKDRQVFVGV